MRRENNTEALRQMSRNTSAMVFRSPVGSYGIKKTTQTKAGAYRRIPCPRYP